MRLTSIKFTARSRADNLLNLLLPYGNLYKITLSSNYAKDSTSIDAYRYVLDNLPGTKHVTMELSKKGKYHYHGLLHSTSSLSYSNFNQGKRTEDGYEYDMHVRYDKIESLEDLRIWILYLCKQQNPIETFDKKRNLGFTQNIIPQIIKKTKYKPIKIKSL